MDYTSLEDNALIALIVHAHPDALAELYRRYNRLVYSLAHRMVSDPHTAEDITLEVFTRVWEKAGTYRSRKAQVRTWLVGITRNRAIDWLRQHNTSLEHNSLSWHDVPPHATPSFDDFEELTLKQQQIRGAMAQLPPEQQEVLALAYFKGYTHRQLAELLNIPLGTIKTRIRLGMQRLYHILNDDQSD